MGFDFKNGQVLNNRYRLLRPLGKGGFSVVWLVEDTVSGTEVAIKIYAPDKGLDQDGLKQFRKEYNRTRGLQHPHLLVPDYLDILPDSQSPFLMMRYCSNGSLSSWILNQKKPTEQEVAKLLEQVGSGLAHLHKKKVIHQDIKPDNILIDGSGDFLLTDFGISRQMQSTLKKATANQSYMTVSYSPPERFIADPVDAPAGDIFSLGVTLYELCTGDLPWDGAGGMLLNTGAQVPNLPESYSGRLNKIVKACMILDYTKRPSALQLMSLAQGFLKEGYWGEVEKKEQPATKPKGRMTQKKPVASTSESFHNGRHAQAETVADFSGVQQDGSSPTSAELMATELLRQGNQKISTISKIKDQFGLSLNEAKSIVERVDPDYKTPEIKSDKKYRNEAANSPKPANQLFAIKATDTVWMRAFKRGADITLQITGFLLMLTAIMVWLGGEGFRGFIEVLPLLLFVMVVLVPVMTTWCRVKISGWKLQEIAIAVLTTFLWPSIIIMALTFILFNY